MESRRAPPVEPWSRSTSSALLATTAAQVAGLGLKSRVGAQQLANLASDAYKRIRPSAPTRDRLQLTRQPAKTPVLPRRLRIHARLRRRYLLSPLCVFQRK
jgi:hypothetical protein